MAAEFQGDVKESREVEVFKGRIWVKNGVYRLEMDHPGRPDSYIIVGAKAATTQVVFPKFKAYMELPSNDMMSVMNDPFQMVKLLPETGHQVKNEGKETIQGQECDRQVFHQHGFEHTRLWTATALGFPIKIAQPSKNDWYVLIQNIRQAPIAETRFRIPVDFSLKTSEELRQIVEADPETAARKEAYKKIRPRKSELQAFLSGEETWNLVLRPGTKIRLKVEAVSGSKDVAWYAIPYKGQRPLKSKGQCTHQGKSDIKIDPDLGADGIRIGTIQGKISARLALIGKMPHVQAARRVFYKAERQGSSWQIRSPFRKYEVGIYAMATPAAGIRFKAQGKEQEIRIPAGESRSFSYTPQDKVRDLDIMIDYGKVKVVCIKDNRAQAVSHVLLDDQRQDADSTAPPKTASQTGNASQKGRTPSTASQPATPAAGSSSTKTSGGERMVLVLDASGSMWGQIDGKPKIAIAKSVMAELVDELPKDLHVGLTVYGHRRKGDCEDIEMVVPVERINPRAIKASIEAISPKGKTPLAASLIQTANTLKDASGQKTIVLVTDGLESCDRDPCKVARKLAASGVVTKIHIVGFDLAGEAMAQLKCIAEPSGGLLVGARNAEELKSALTEVVTVSLPHNLVVKGLDANNKPVYVSVRISKAGRQVARSSGSTLRYSLPAGSYSVTVRHHPLDQTIVLKDVTVEENRLTEKEVVFAQSKLNIKSLDGNHTALYSTAVVYKAGTDEKVKKHNGSNHSFTLLPGVYDVKVTCNPIKTDKWLRSIALKANDQLEKQVQFALGKIKLTALGPDGKKLYLGVTVYPSGSSNKIHRATGGSPTFTLKPGAYDIHVRAGSIKAEKWLRGIAIENGADIKKQVQF